MKLLMLSVVWVVGWVALWRWLDGGVWMFFVALLPVGIAYIGEHFWQPTQGPWNQPTNPSDDDPPKTIGH